MIRSERTYRNDLDLLKGVAILAVVLYHMGITPSGYLGVDVFLVINGFLIVPKVIYDVSIDRFCYLSFLFKRIVRLLPLMLLLSLVSLVIGYRLMLPDDYENLSQSVIATNFFSNNILSAVTTKNYWDVVNEYKPLMHTWYIGILFEFYLLFPLVVMLVKWLSKRIHFGFHKYVVMTILALSAVSFLLYLHPAIAAGDRFYLLPSRFFELALGGLAGYWLTYRREGSLYSHGIWSGITFLLLLLVLFFGVVTVDGQNADYSLVTAAKMESDSFIPQNILLLITIVLTIFLVVSDNKKSRILTCLMSAKVFCALGVMSYGIFIWHQPVLAFYRYSVSGSITLPFVVCFASVVLLLSFLSYRFVEQRIRGGLRTGIFILLLFVLINGVAFALYRRAGVVRDVPELYVRMGDVHRGMFAEYNDRVYSYDIDFPHDSDKINVLVVGNSFARDWANILLESKMADRINLSYIFQPDEKHVERIRQCDYVFVFDWKHNVPYYLWENIKDGAEVWGIGTKNYGECNGIIYRHRNRSDYFQQKVKINPDFFTINERMKSEWKDKYVDLLGMSVVDNGTVVVFSEDHKFMSQDTRHLSKGGAEYYAKKIDFEKMFRQ